jgi:hypothetical protein
MEVMEHAATPSPSIVFTFGFAIESIKELGGASLDMIGDHLRVPLLLFLVLMQINNQ